MSHELPHSHTNSNPNYLGIADRSVGRGVLCMGDLSEPQRQPAAMHRARVAWGYCANVRYATPIPSSVELRRLSVGNRLEEKVAFFVLKPCSQTGRTRQLGTEIARVDRQDLQREHPGHWIVKSDECGGRLLFFVLLSARLYTYIVVNLFQTGDQNRSAGT